MAQPIYFLPNIEAKNLFLPNSDRLSRDTLRAHGVDDVFADVQKKGDCAIQEWRDKGPGGKSGLFLCALKECPTRDIPQHWGYYPDFQKWEVRTKGLPAWIGWNPDVPPTAADLRRKSLCAGYDLELSDGGKWHVPVIRRPDDTSSLPQQMFQECDGSLSMPIKDEWQSHFEQTKLTLLWLLCPEKPAADVGFSKEKAFDLAVRGLSVNYRFGHAEQRIVRPIDKQNILTILSATADFPRYQDVDEAAKKKLLAACIPTITPGPQDVSPATAPAPPTSG